MYIESCARRLQGLFEITCTCHHLFYNFFYNSETLKLSEENLS